MVDPSRASWRNLPGRVITGWPRLLIAAGISVLVLAGALLLHTSLTTGLLIAWDAGVIFFLVALAQLMATAGVADIRQRAARQDVGQFVVLALTAVATLASVAAIYAEVGRSAEAGTATTWSMALAVGTIVLSWLFVHSIFAVHYAHEYYAPTNEAPRGLAFPGDPSEPDYWDFAYFALVIGMTSQVSDVAVTSQRIRRTVTAHGIVAFWFNVALLALVVNIAADAIRP